MLSSLFVQSASHRTHTRWVNALFVTWLSVSSFSVSADSLNNARNIERQTNQNATKCSKKD